MNLLLKLTITAGYLALVGGGYYYAVTGPPGSRLPSA